VRNKKYWLIIKAILIIMLTLIIFAVPTTDVFRKWFRFIMLTIFVVRFIIDLSAYKNNND